MFLRTFAASTLAITLSLYIMEFIPKHGLVSCELLRLALSTSPGRSGRASASGST